MLATELIESYILFNAFYSRVLSVSSLYEQSNESLKDDISEVFRKNVASCVIGGMYSPKLNFISNHMDSTI